MTFRIEGTLLQRYAVDLHTAVRVRGNDLVVFTPFCSWGLVFLFGCVELPFIWGSW